MKCDEMRASGTPPEDCDGSGTEEGQPQNRKEHQEYLVPRTPTVLNAATAKRTIVYTGSESYSYREYFL